METSARHLSLSVRVLLIAAIASVAVRLLLLGFVELIPEEAYYWNYANHLALGYLDHPPLSAWMIALGTRIFGLNEFGVRSGSFFASLICAYYVYQITFIISDRLAARVSLAAGALLPYFLGNSFYMTPDAPMVAAWAAAVYFLMKIIALPINAPRQWANWSALGVALGLGMLSKYAIALLAAAAALYFIYQKSLRPWILKPQPYFALLIALILFSPVIYWNATHEWASFAFQTTRRLAETPRFSLFDIIGHIFLLATPAGVILAVLFISDRGAKKTIADGSHDQLTAGFLKFASFFPIAVFLFFSIRHEPRVNWAGPPLIALLPLFGCGILAGTDEHWLKRFSIKSFPALLIISFVGLSAFWTYCGVGLPWIGYPKNIGRFVGWEDLGNTIFSIARTVAKDSGTEPFILGMDKHYTAAELAFYTRRAALRSNLAAPEIAGRSIVGLESLMFQYWRPREDIAGKPAVIVSRNRGDLELPELMRGFAVLGPIVEFRSVRNSKPAGIFYYRLGQNFHGFDPLSAENV